MRHASLTLHDGTPVARLLITETPWERMRGLLGAPDLPVGEVLLLSPCGAIHTLGMRFALDVLFLDASWRVVSIRPSLRPGRLALGGWTACRTLEAAAGWLDLPSLVNARFLPPEV